MNDLLDQYLTPKPNGADPLDAVYEERERQRAMAQVITASGRPDEAARAQALSRQTGYPVDTVKRNMGRVEADAAQAKARTIMGQHPTVSAWASQPGNADLATDDWEQLAKNAAYWRRSTSGSIRATPEIAPTVGSWITGIGTNLVEAARQLGSSVRGFASDWAPDILPKPRAGVPALGDFGQENANREQRQHKARSDAANPTFKSAYMRGLYGGAASLAQTLPNVALGVLTGNPAIALAGMGLQSGLPAYSKYRERGGTRGEALSGGALEGGIEAATEMLPMGFLVKGLGKAGVGKFVAGWVGRELSTEMVATLTQNAVDTAIANPDKTWGEYIKEQPDALVQTALGTLVSGGFFAGAHLAAQKLGPSHVAAAEAADDAAFIDGAMKQAAESKVRLRSKGAFEDFINRHAQGTRVESLYIAADAHQYFFQSPENAQ